MAKITLPTIASGFASNTEFNTAFDAIEAELQNKVLYRNNTSGETNTMTQALDMNSQAINNCAGLSCTTISVGGTDLTASVTAAGVSAAAASTSAAAAGVSATSAAASASTTVAAAAGIKWKNSVKCATTVNITLAADNQTLDGIGASAGSRILVKDQTDAEDNGIYVVPTGSGAWTRATDLNVFDHFPSAAVLIEQGSTHGDTAFICIVDQGGTLDTTDLVWEPFGLVTATSISGLNVSGTAISIVPTNATAAAFATDRGGADTLLFADASNSNVLRKSTVAELAAALPVTTVPAGGTGVGTLTDGGILLGSGTGAITPMAALGSGVIVVGDGSGDPSTESLVDTARTWTAAQRGEVTPLTSAATVTIDMAVSNNFSVTMAHNIIFANTSNNTAGQSGSIFITQPASGNHTVSFGTDWDFAGGTAPTLSTAVDAVDRIDYIIKGVDDIQCVVTLAYS